MKPVKRYFFVVRAYNDIDHFTPLIDYLTRNKLAQVFLFSSLYLGHLLPNENLRYLERTYGIKPSYLLEKAATGWVKRLENIYVHISSFSSKLLLPVKIQILVNKILGILYRFFQKQYKQKNYNWAAQIWKDVEPDLVVYDWVSPDSFPYLPITLLAKENNVPVISIPHGVNPFLDQKYTSKSQQHVKEAERKRLEENLNFDWEVAHSQSNAQHMINRGVEKERIVVLGSVRFEDLWMKTQSAVFKDYEFQYKCKKNALKIVIFPNKLLYKGKISEIRDLVRATCKVSKCVVIKPHTRGMKIDFLRDLIVKHDIRVAMHETPSSLLIDWCDVGVVWGSSIGIQLLGKKKSLIYPQFVHDNSTIFSKHLPNCKALNIEHYIELLSQLDSEKACCYTDKQRMALLEDQVYVGNSSDCIVRKYADFFNKISS